LSHYRSRGREMIKIRIADLLDANPAKVSFFCRCNSGALRQQPGRVPVKRGPAIFAPAGGFAGAPSRVVDLVFESQVRLPEKFEVL